MAGGTSLTAWSVHTTLRPWSSALWALVGSAPLYFGVSSPLTWNSTTPTATDCPRSWKRELGLTYHPTAVSLVEMCDVVTINTPLHPETEGMFDDALIGRMKRGAYIVNTARGKICDRDAIARALARGHLAGYTGDVWFPQPAPRTTPGAPCPTTA